MTNFAAFERALAQEPDGQSAEDQDERDAILAEAERAAADLWVAIIMLRTEGARGR